jgi:soluble lytic murein transglycosylase-like protein
MNRLLFAATLFLQGTLSLRADRPSVSPDFDAAFARAADLLEAGKRPEAEQALQSIREKSGERAWEARAELLLAVDDLRRKDFAAAVRRLRLAPAEAIGLEPHRRALLARTLSAAGLPAEAAREAKAAFETEEPFAGHVAAGRALASALEKSGDPRGAAAVLAKATETATRSEMPPIAADRIRLGLAAGDSAAVRSAARDLLFSGASPDSVPPPIRAAVKREEARLEPVDRGQLGATLIAAGSVERGVKLLRKDPQGLWPKTQRAAYQLALARGELRLGHAPAAEKAAAAVARDESAADFEARLFLVDLKLDRARGRKPKLDSKDAAAVFSRQALLALLVASAPEAVRIGAHARLIRLDCDADRFDVALEHARVIRVESPGSSQGFEPLWKLSWDLYRSGDFAGARARIEALAGIYEEPNRARRLSYWLGRCLEHLGKAEEAARLYESLAAADPGDVYAFFARQRSPGSGPVKPPLVTDPSVATATFRRADELLRLRLFEDATAEARSLPVSRGRDLRLAEAEFALGHFPAAAEAARRAFPDLGTPMEGRVPDGWRRLYYPIEEKGFLAERAREAGLDPAVLRALVRQESVFDPRARSRAGALGLTQLMPATARSLSRSLLRARYRQAFLYDPGVNARLGAAYFKSLLDRFNGRTLFALAAYNGGPTRMARVLRDNAGHDEEEIFESHPAYETRDYVRRVMLYAESYRELYR